MFNKRIANLNMCKLLMYVFTVAVTVESVGLRNIAVISGSTASFSCIIHANESQVCWSRQTISPETINYLYDQGSLRSACDHNKCDVTFDNETDRYTLTINSVQLYDAGFYDCYKCYGSVVYISALLTVIQPADMTEGMLSARVGCLYFIILRKRSLT